MNKLYIAGIGLVVLLVLIVVLVQKKPDRSDTVVNATTTMTSSSPKASEPTITPDDTLLALVSLDLSGQGLVKTPMTIFTQTDIEELNLSGNALEGSLPAEIWHLAKLRVLNLSHNTFSGVPSEIGQLQNLEVLDLSYNNLTGLPHELGNLTHLKTLNLKGNKYSTQDLEIIKKTLQAGTAILTD